LSTSPSLSPPPQRRKTVIAAGLLCGILALVVTFTDRKEFFSPLAVVIVAAIGAAAVMLQLRFHNSDQSRAVHPPIWLNIVGIVFAAAAFLGDWLHLSLQTAQLFALIAVGSFGVSSAIILQAFRKPRRKN
jgi:uncharacterized membrane protein